jgi:hypothetical protein
LSTSATTNGAAAASSAAATTIPAVRPNRRPASRASSTQPAPASTHTSAAGSAT